MFRPHHARDPLLLAGTVVAILLQALMALAAFALFLAAGAVVLFRGEVIAEYASRAGDRAIAFPVFELAGVMLVGLAIVALMFLFFGKLRQIIATVGEGDPFQPANADRLAAMAWLMLGVQLLLLPAIALGVRLARLADDIEGTRVTVDGGINLAGILLVIILFILARVFRHGAAMREDLEATV